jgi:hypothetical protein
LAGNRNLQILIDLALNGNYIVELFSFPNPPKDLLVLKAAVCVAFEVNNNGTNTFFFKTTFLQKTVDEYTGNNFLLLIQMIYHRVLRVLTNNLSLNPTY